MVIKSSIIDFQKNGIELIDEKSIKQQIIPQIREQLGIIEDPIGNMSIVEWNNGYMLAVRAFGYQFNLRSDRNILHKYIYGGQDYVPYIVQLDRNFDIRQVFPVRNIEFYENEKLRFEDPRIFIWENKLYLQQTAVHGSIPDNKYLPRISVHRMDFDNYFVDLKLLYDSMQYSRSWKEKNWMPVPDKPFLFVKNTSEHGAETFDIKLNRMYGSFERETAFNGGSSLIKCGNGYFSVVHRRHSMAKNFYHNFMLKFDNNFNIVKISKPFKFTKFDVEYVSSMIEYGGDLMILFTIFDQFPFIYIVDRQKLFEQIDF